MLTLLKKRPIMKNQLKALLAACCMLTAQGMINKSSTSKDASVSKSADSRHLVQPLWFLDNDNAPQLGNRRLIGIIRISNFSHPSITFAKVFPSRTVVVGNEKEALVIPCNGKYSDLKMKIPPVRSIYETHNNKKEPCFVGLGYDNQSILCAQRAQHGGLGEYDWSVLPKDTCLKQMGQLQDGRIFVQLRENDKNSDRYVYFNSEWTGNVEYQLNEDVPLNVLAEWTKEEARNAYNIQTVCKQNLHNKNLQLCTPLIHRLCSGLQEASPGICFRAAIQYHPQMNLSGVGLEEVYKCFITDHCTVVCHSNMISLWANNSFIMNKLPENLMVS
jgi:hypothetical protein